MFHILFDSLHAGQHFQSCLDKSSRVEPVFRRDLCVLLKDTLSFETTAEILLSNGLSKQPTLVKC